MSNPWPPWLEDEGRAVETVIRRAFAGVTREAGISWSESALIDRLVDEDTAAMEAARAQDTDASWEDLVEAPGWCSEPAFGGFNVLDAVGVRYYLAPAMIRAIRGGESEFLGYFLDMPSEPDEYKAAQISLLTPAQGRAVFRYLELMALDEAHRGDNPALSSSASALNKYWRRFAQTPDG